LVNPGRSFLFLQGMATRFFERLGQTLIERGYAVYRVNFNGGDRAFWRLPGAVDFCGRPEEWPEFLDRLIVERAISDIILFGDCRPLHRAANPRRRGPCLANSRGRGGLSAARLDHL